MKFHLLLERFWRGQSLVFSEITHFKTSLFFAPQGQFIGRLVWTEAGAGMGKVLRKVGTLGCHCCLWGLTKNKQLHTELLRLHWIWMNYKIIRCLILFVFLLNLTDWGWNSWKYSEEWFSVYCKLDPKKKKSDNLCLDFFWFQICIFTILNFSSTWLKYQFKNIWQQKCGISRFHEQDHTSNPSCKTSINQPACLYQAQTPLRCYVSSSRSLRVLLLIYRTTLSVISRKVVVLASEVSPTN